MKRMVLKILTLSVLVALVLWPLPSMAANTTLIERNAIQIIPDGTTDWIMTDELSGRDTGIKVLSIQFLPSATSDRLVISNGTLSAIPLFDSGVVLNTGAVIKYYPSTQGYGKLALPIIETDNCTFGTAANVRIYIEYE